MNRRMLVGWTTAALVAATTVAVAVPAWAHSDGPPSGATAVCRDGTYSFSATHSGSCSHHGGVAQWLDGGTTAPPATPTPTPTPAATTTSPATAAAAPPVAAPAAPPAAAAPTVTPPGATARCADGSYSFSQHHSGTCSHHGGVAQWLDGTTGATTSTKAGKAALPKATAGAVTLGKVVYLRKQTKTTGCVLGPEPDRHCSPGAYYSGLTKAVLCSPSFHTSSVRNVPASEKHQVETEYGLAPRGYGSTMEIDHIISLELGGSNDSANLFPEKANAAPGFHVKDKLENEAHRWVCAGKISLHAAQVAIATDWEKLYKRVFGVSPA